MGTHLLFVGSTFLYNKPLVAYLQRKIQEMGLELKSIRYLKEGDNSLFLTIEEELLSTEQLLIITTPTTQKTVSKILSTLLEDSLELQEEMLVPSTTKQITAQSYLVEQNQCRINVVVVEYGKKLPEIFLQGVQKSVLQIFDETQENIQLVLEPLSQTYEVHLEYNTLIQGWVEVYITAKRYGDSNKFMQAVKKLLSQKTIISSNIMQHIIVSLEEAGKKITFAESCTGGLLSYFLTQNNGASAVLDGSLVTYANHIKESWLAVEEKVLEEFGAVSAAVVEQMSEGALGVSEADFAISVSGIAGDSGGTPEKPVGTVYINVRSKEKDTTLHLQLQGDRNYVQYQSVLFGIKTLLVENKAIFF